jgi:hypothetical protein
MASMDEALSLLTAANSHGDLTVKLSSLKQAKDVLLSLEPSLAAELFPSLVELQYSPEGIVRQKLVELVSKPYFLHFLVNYPNFCYDCSNLVANCVIRRGSFRVRVSL